MMREIGSRGRAGRVAAALVALLGLARLPLPQPDFHNIRHHDAPGEVCEHHDHLLRWHPGAGSATDVAVLHWHWFLLRGDGSDPAPEGPGQAIHAHAPDFDATLDEAPPVVTTDSTFRHDGKGSAPVGLLVARLPADPLDLLPAAIGRSGHPLHTPLARGPRLNSLLQRWVC